MIECLKKHKDIISYLFFGVCTTLINIIVYYVFSHIFNCSTLVSTIFAWIIACLFAYFTNRKWVFHSKNKHKKEIFLEIVSFFACRLATGVVDWVIMVVFVDFIHFNDIMIKVIANIIVIVLNYIASKLIIFNNKKVKSKKIKFNFQFFLSIVILMLFIGFFINDGINFISHDYLGYDDAYNATVAANMYRYGKYMVSYPFYTVFYNMITTGPVVLLPTAMFYHFFGINSITSRIVPLLFSVFDIILLYCIFVFILKKFKYRYILSSIMTILLCISDSLFIYISCHLIGESAALFFVLLGVLSLLFYHSKSNPIFLSLFGGCLAVSFLTKSSMIFIVVSFFGMIVIEFLFKRIKFSHLIWFFGGFLFFFFLFDVFKLIQLGGFSNYIKYWVDEVDNMFQQSSGIVVNASIKNKFMYLYEIFGIKPFISLIIILIPVIIYCFVFIKSLFSKTRIILKKNYYFYDMILFGVATASLLVFFILFGGPGLMYARRHIVNSFSLKIVFVFLILELSYYIYNKILLRINSCKIRKFICIVVSFCLLLSIFSISNLKYNFISMQSKEYKDDYRKILYKELRKTIDELDGDVYFYTAGWWQEPNITLDYPKTRMISIFDVAYGGVEFMGNDYFLVGCNIDGIQKSDIENLLDVKLVRVNDNIIDYSKNLSRFNRMDFELFSIYKIEKNL